MSTPLPSRPSFSLSASSSRPSTPSHFNSGHTTTPRSNPLSARIYNVLSTTYDDRAHDALRVLSDLYNHPSSSTSTSTSASSVATRARKTLKRDVELQLSQNSRKFLAALKDIDTELDTLTAHVESMRVRCDEAHVQLRHTNEACSSLLDRAGGLRAQRHLLASQRTLTESFIAHFTLTPSQSALLLQPSHSRTLSAIDRSFFNALEKAEQIREDGVLLMVGREEGMNKAGTDIVATASNHLHRGLETLSRWCILEFRSMDKDAHPEATPVMQMAISWLSKSPEILDEVLQTLAQTRQNALTTAFSNALTRGSSSHPSTSSRSTFPSSTTASTGPRPIELHAHDPMRYVGDMLAFVHQAVAEEVEFLEALFGVGSQGRMVGSRRVVGASGDEYEDVEPGFSVTTAQKSSTTTTQALLIHLRHILDTALSPTCTTLATRIAQTVRAQENARVSYRVANLLVFYTEVMRRSVGERVGLVRALEGMSQTAFQGFYDNVDAQVRNLSRSFILDPSTSYAYSSPSNSNPLTPPPPFLDHVQILRDLMEVYKSEAEAEAESRPGSVGLTSLGSSDSKREKGDDGNDAGDSEDGDGHTKHHEGFQRVLDSMVGAAVEVCVRGDHDSASTPVQATQDSAKAKSKGGRGTKEGGVVEWDGLVFVVNCLTYLRDSIRPYTFAAYKVDELQKEIDVRVRRLEEDHFKDILRDAHLDECAAVCEQERSEPISRIGAMQPSELSISLTHFATYLSNPDLLTSHTTQPTTQLPTQQTTSTSTPSTTTTLPTTLLTTHPHTHHLPHLLDTTLSNSIHHRAIQRLINTYATICEAVRDPRNRYEAGSTLLGRQRPFGSLVVLRQIFGC